MGEPWVRVDAEVIDPAALTQVVLRPAAGALTSFVGIVRNHDQAATGEVTKLVYTAHPTATERMQQIVAEVLAEVDPAGESRAVAAHRIGELSVGEVAFAVAVSAPHRRLAFAACEGIVEAVKAGLPVWKQQFEADGSYRWSGL